MRALERVCIVLAVVAAVAATLPANAAPDALAGQRFREGLQHYDQRRYEQARLAFVQAHAIDPQPLYLLHLGHAELRVDRAAEAATHLARYLRENPQASDADRLEADLDFSAARARVTEVTFAGPPGAEVWVDGVSIGKLPMEHPAFVVPGLRTFSAKEGARADEKQIEAVPGRTLRVGLLEPEPKPEPVVAPEPAPTERGAADAGSGERRPFVEWFKDTPLAWVGAGVTGAGLVVGTTFALTAKTHFDRANGIRDDLIAATPEGSRCTSPTNDVNAAACREFTDAKDTGETQRTIAIVGFAVSGAALAGTVLFYFVDPGARVGDRARLSVAPVVTGSARGLTIAGRF